MILLSALFLASVIVAPWWVTLSVALLLAPHRYSLPVLAGGGALMDVLYGAPIAAIAHTTLLYSIVFVGIALLARAVGPYIYE